MALRLWLWLVLGAAAGAQAPADPVRIQGTQDRREPSPAPFPVPAPPRSEPPPAARAGPEAGREDALPFTSYRLGSEDLISVQVLDAPEFSRLVRVSGEGTIRLPLVRQPIAAAGKTAAELEQTVARILAEEGLLREPVVTVTVREFQSKPVSVTGAVRSPVVFQALRPLTLMEALTRAGGVSDAAGREVLVTIPARDGRPEREVRVSIEKLLRLGDPEANLTLYGGEEVRVMPAGRAYIIGGVSRPGPVLLLDDRPLTVLQAVSMAGGPVGTSGNKAYLLRAQPGGAYRQEKTFDLKKIMKEGKGDFVLEPNDVIFVPDSAARHAARGGATAALNALIYAATGALVWR